VKYPYAHIDNIEAPRVSLQSWIGLQSQLQALYKLITDQNEIEQISYLVKFANWRQTLVLEPRSLCDGNQFEETRNPVFDIAEYTLRFEIWRQQIW
jgi:hypothetical protein